MLADQQEKADVVPARCWSTGQEATPHELRERPHGAGLFDEPTLPLGSV